MIIESSFLKKILEIIYHEQIINEEILLEIRACEENINIAINYNDEYYINYSFKQNQNENFTILMNHESLIKLIKLINTWPKSKISIEIEFEHYNIKVVDYGNLIRENPVEVDCLFKIPDKDYGLIPPEMIPNVSVNCKNLRQMLDFCASVDETFINLENNYLIISNKNKSLWTKVKVEEILNKTTNVIKILPKASILIISFLSKLPLCDLFLMFIEKNFSFSIQIIFSENEKVQIYAN